MQLAKVGKFFSKSFYLLTRKEPAILRASWYAVLSAQLTKQQMKRNLCLVAAKRKTSQNMMQHK